MLNSNELLKLLNDKNYKYELHKHEALFTVEESNKLRGKIKRLT